MALLAEVELTEKAKSQVRTLSGGQKQRFSIAAALVNDPAILFLDEPTTGLDRRRAVTSWGVVQELAQRGHTIVLTTHYMERGGAALPPGGDHGLAARSSPLTRPTP
jgi:ABC-2 type transport system ATP-binding protein